MGSNKHTSSSGVTWCEPPRYAGEVDFTVFVIMACVLVIFLSSALQLWLQRRGDKRAEELAMRAAGGELIMDESGNMTPRGLRRGVASNSHANLEIVDGADLMRNAWNAAGEEENDTAQLIGLPVRQK